MLSTNNNMRNKFANIDKVDIKKGINVFFSEKNITEKIFIKPNAGSPIEYITIASTGNATTFGTLSPTYVGYGGAACSSSTRAIWAGGSSGNIVNNISYVTIASTGNSTDFGDLTETKYNIAGCTNSTTAYFFGGQGSSGAVQNIDKITIASTGNATDTGVDVKTTSSTYGMAASGSHGGIS